MSNKLFIVGSFLVLLSLSACAKEQKNNCIPENLWKHLSSEQKQLIVEKTYQDKSKEYKVFGKQP